MRKSAHLKKLSVVPDKDVCFTQTFFPFYIEIIMRNIEGFPEIKVGGHNINNLRCADDPVLIAKNKEDLQ